MLPPESRAHSRHGRLLEEPPHNRVVKRAASLDLRQFGYLLQSYHLARGR
jgi:hypothetical protein